MKIFSSKKQTKQDGFSLLEVVLAIAILGLTIPILGDLLSQGFSSAAAVRELSVAHRYAETIYNEIAAGIIPAVPAADTPVQDGESIDWVYDVEIIDAEVGYEGLLNISITVRQNLDEADEPYKFTLTGWITDPEIEFAAEEQAEEGIEPEATESADDSQNSNTPAGNTPPSGNVPGNIPGNIPSSIP